jgi:hypothetical protein
MRILFGGYWRLGPFKFPTGQGGQAHGDRSEGLHQVSLKADPAGARVLREPIGGLPGARDEAERVRTERYKPEKDDGCHPTGSLPLQELR